MPAMSAFHVTMLNDRRLIVPLYLVVAASIVCWTLPVVIVLCFSKCRRYGLVQRHQPAPLLGW